MRLLCLLVFSATLFSQAARDGATQEVQDEQINELSRRLEKAEEIRTQVDINTNRLTSIETTLEINRWLLSGMIIPIILLGIKAALDMAASKKKNGNGNGINEILERLRGLEDRIDR